MVRCAFIWLLLSALSIPLGIIGASLKGVAGVSCWSKTVVTIIGHLVTILLACSIMKVSLITYFKETLMRVALPLMLLIVVLWTLSSVCTVKSYLNLLVQILAAGFVYIVAVWRISLGVDARGRFRERMEGMGHCL